MTELHKNLDGHHCFKCGKDLRERGSKTHGVIGMTYRAMGKAVVACDDHKDDLTQLFIKKKREAIFHDH